MELPTSKKALWEWVSRRFTSKAKHMYVKLLVDHGLDEASALFEVLRKLDTRAFEKDDKE